MLLSKNARYALWPICKKKYLILLLYFYVIICKTGEKLSNSIQKSARTYNDLWSEIFLIWNFVNLCFTVFDLLHKSPHCWQTSKWQAFSQFGCNWMQMFLESLWSCAPPPILWSVSYCEVRILSNMCKEILKWVQLNPL